MWDLRPIDPGCLYKQNGVSEPRNTAVSNRQKIQKLVFLLESQDRNADMLVLVHWDSFHYFSELQNYKLIQMFYFKSQSLW